MMNPKTEALAFRIWQWANEREWDCNVNEIAEALGEPIVRVTTVCSIKGWCGRLRAADSYKCGRFVQKTNMLELLRYSYDGGTVIRDIGALING